MATIHTLTPRDRHPSGKIIARSRVEGALTLALDTVDHLIATLNDLDGLHGPDDWRGGLDLPPTEAPSRVVWLCRAGLDSGRGDSDQAG